MGFEAVIAIKVIIGSGALVAAATGAYAASAKRRAAWRRMREAPRQIDDLAVVTLVGTVKQRGEPLEAALSGKPCVAYRASGRAVSSPHTAAVREVEVIESVMKPFTLVTDHGEIVVDGTTCEIPIRPGGVVPRRIEREQAFLDRHAIAAHARDGKFDEALVAAGDRVAVYGVARVVITAAGEATYREAARTIRLVGDETHPLTIAET